MTTSEAKAHTTDDAASNYVKLLINLQEKSKLIMLAILNNKQMQPEGTSGFMTYYMGLWQQYQEALLKHPESLFETQLQYFNKSMQIWTQAMQGFLSGASHPAEQPSQDSRFKNQLWQTNPLFNAIKSSYCLTAESLMTLIKQCDDIDDSLKNKITFFTQQFIDALAPTNFPLTNPDVITKMINTNGQSLIDGLDRLLEDVENRLGQISTTNFRAFHVGDNIACTKGQVVYKNKLIELIQYTPLTEKVFKQPMLIVPPCINKYYILDLGENNSMARWLLEQGHQVFMVSWHNPDKSYAETTLEDYVNLGPLAALHFITENYSNSKINAMGFCIGGTLLSMAASILADKKIDVINTCSYLTTLIDYSDPGEISVFIDEAQVEILDHLCSQQGYMDGFRLSSGFNMLRPNDLIWNNFITNYLQGEMPPAFDILYWNSDSTNLPAKMYSQYLHWLYLENRLLKPGAIAMLGSELDVQKIKTPSYFLAATRDHIAPWKTCYRGMQQHGGNKTFVLTTSGHIAGVVNPPCNNKYQFQPLSTEHMSIDETAWQNGSWWTNWNTWLQSHSGELITPKAPKDTLYPAPGTYVLAQCANILMQDFSNKIQTAMDDYMKSDSAAPTSG